jgi:hypothetical protein
MRYLVGLVLALVLGLIGCSDGSGEGGSGGTAGDGGSGGTAGIGGAGACADWAGQWTLSGVSCDGVAESVPDADVSITANCTAEQIFTESATCEGTAQFVFIPEAEDTKVDPGEVTCSAGCTVDQCQATADWGQPYTSTISRSGNTLTNTTLVTDQMVSDEVTPCQAGETMVSVMVAM